MPREKKDYSTGLGISPPTPTSGTIRFYRFCRQNEEPTSGLEPLTCSLRVIHHALLGCAVACKSRIPRRLPLLWVAACCTVVRSRWYQSGINVTLHPRDSEASIKARARRTSAPIWRRSRGASRSPFFGRAVLPRSRREHRSSCALCSSAKRVGRLENVGEGTGPDRDRPGN
jgi:hypothetical protein